MTCMTPYHSSTFVPLSNIYCVRWSQTYIQALKRLETKCEKSISSSYQKRRKKKSTTHTHVKLFEKRGERLWPLPLEFRGQSLTVTSEPRSFPSEPQKPRRPHLGMRCHNTGESPANNWGEHCHPQQQLLAMTRKAPPRQIETHAHWTKKKK